jgi:DNA-binding MarR family transcriptional regulator
MSRLPGSCRACRQLPFSLGAELDHAPSCARAELDRSKRPGYYWDDFFRYFLNPEPGARFTTAGDRKVCPRQKGDVAIKTTRRQRAFLSQFLDLYQRHKQALHYSIVAEELDVKKTTAYEMLRLLEDRGLVASEYVLPKEHAGPGRSTIVFYPTEKATALMSQLAGQAWESEEWDQVRERILRALHDGRGTGYQDLLNEILLRIPQRKSPMLYAGELITAVILHVYQLRGEAGTRRLFTTLKSLGLPGELGLNALTGLTLGLTLVERANRRFATMILSYAAKYEEHLARLSAENRRSLADFVREVLETIGV